MNKKTQDLTLNVNEGVFMEPETPVTLGQFIERLQRIEKTMGSDARLLMMGAFGADAEIWQVSVYDRDGVYTYDPEVDGAHVYIHSGAPVPKERI